MDDKGIFKVLDEKEIVYLQNKNKGGANNRKGAGYEDCFMTFKILESSSLHQSQISQVEVQDQVLCYVDDLQIKTPIDTCYFQLKNSKSVFWGENTKNRTIANDFKRQFDLSTALGEKNPKTTLVVSCEQSRERLNQDTPNEIARHTNVYHFPDTSGSFNQLIAENHGGVKEMLRAITMVDNPSDDVLEGTFSSLLIAKRSRGEVMTVKDVLTHASKIFPTQVRPFPINQDWLSYINPNFREILDRISGLTYGMERGVFHWKGYGTSGVFGSAVNTEIFTLFQEKIINNPPTDFEEFEEALP